MAASKMNNIEKYLGQMTVRMAAPRRSLIQQSLLSYALFEHAAINEVLVKIGYGIRIKIDENKNNQ